MNKGFFSKYKYDLLLISPAVLVVFIFKLIPVIVSFSMSFTKWRIIDTPEFIGLDNFIQMFQDPYFWNAMWNTIFYAILIIPSVLVGSLAIALILNALNKGASFYKAAYYLPMTLPLSIAAVIWRGGFFGTFGFVNNMLTKIGLNSIDFFSISLVKPSISLVYLWWTLGFCSLIYLAGLRGISGSMLEAAEIDGANTFQKIIYIIWPSLKPITLFVSLYITQTTFRIFSAVFAMTGGGPSRSSEPLLYYAYNWGWQDFRMGYSAAAAVILFLMVISVYLFQSWVLKED